ncbi:MAG: hypothetical protein HKN91_04130 [Acidimicrobiia bacterium]|nr:hypothetical protein [Acidimicrobiia bacterium]
MAHVTATTLEPNSATSFDDLYANVRGDLYRSLALITDDRDLATEAVDVGFTRWRRKLRKPSGVAPAAGVMAGAFKFASKQSGRMSNMSGFRLQSERPASDQPYLDRFRHLSLDERAILVMRDVLGWDSDSIGHAVGAEGVQRVAASIDDRMTAAGSDPSRMAEALRVAAVGYTEPLSRLETVKAKGGLQKVGAFAGGAALLATAVVGGAAVINSIGSSPTGPDGGETSSTTIAAATGPALTAENAVWQRVPTPGDSDNIMTLAHDGEKFVMLATDERGRPTMLESDNGLEWAQIPAPPAGQNTWFQQMVATGDKLILIANGFDEFRGNESTIVFVSTEDGGWSQADLPLEDSIEVDGQVLDLYTWVSNVSVTDEGITVVGNQGAEFDVERLVRDNVDPELFNQGWGTTTEGMQFFDDFGNIKETLTWDELGISPEVGALLGGNRPIIWTSSDGLDWEVSISDMPAGTQGVGAFVTTGAVDAIVAWGQRGQSVWVKTEGEWQRPDIDGTVNGLTSFDGKLVVAGVDNTTGRPASWSSVDGTTWEHSDMPIAVQQFYQSSDSLVGYGTDQNLAVIGPAEIQVDDLTVQNTSDGRFIVKDAEGNIVVEVLDEDIVRGEFISITDPNSGEQIVQFSNRELEDAWNLVYQQLENRNPGPPTVSIVISDDGKNWTLLQPEEPNFFPQAVAYGNNSALMAGWVEGDFFGIGGGMQLLLVTAG